MSNRPSRFFLSPPTIVGGEGYLRVSAMDPLYFNLKEAKRESALGFLVESLLKSRIEMGLQQDPADPDEDVNIYLAFLLLEATLPTFKERMERYTSRRDTDVFKMIEESQDNTLKYQVYKTNADHLLFSLGILQQVGNPVGPEAAFFEKTKQAYEGYAKTYYHFASEYHHLIYRKPTGIGIVLNKLSHSFERYEQILLHVRREYLDFYHTQEESFSKFLKELDRLETDLRLREKQDLFLDQYAQYLRTKDPLLKEVLLATIQEIQLLDPSFVPPAL